MRRNGFVPTLLGVSLLLFSACAGESQPAGDGASSKFPLTVPSCERTVTVEQPAKRVLTVASDSATALAAIGAADFDGIYRTLETYGQILGTEDVTTRTVADRGPSMSNAVLTALGLTNAFADVNQRLADVSTEELLARNPDVILLAFGGAETNIKNGADAERALRSMTPLGQLTAVREQRLVAINFAYLVGGPLTIDGLETIAQDLAALR